MAQPQITPVSADGGSYTTPAGRTPAATPQEELKREARRVEEQLNKLNIIINNVGEELEFIATTLGGYQGGFKQRIDNLSQEILDYKPIATSIYTELANSMTLFANRFDEHIEYASEQVSSLSEITKSLKS